MTDPCAALLAKLETEDSSSDSEVDRFEEVAAWEEGGTTINEHYSRDDYVKRRVHFLGQHPDWKRRSLVTTGLFPIIRRTAQEIYTSEGEKKLSVQEVRRREVQCGVLPLLPLPTTTNCDAMDGFRSYPSQEWTPAVDTPAETDSKTATVSKAPVRTASTTKDLDQLKQTTNTSSSQVLKTSGSSDLTIPSLNNITSASGPTTDNMASSPEVSDLTDSYFDDELAQTTLSKRAWVQQRIIPNLGKDRGNGKLTTPHQNDTADTRSDSETGLPVLMTEASSLSGRAVVGVPVKGRGKRAAAQTSNADEPSESDDTPEQTAEQTPPPAKKKQKVSSAPRKSTRVASAPQKETATKPRKKSSQAASSPQKETAAKTRRESTREIAPNLFEEVLAGTELPRTPNDAKVAAETRYKQVLAQRKKADAALKMSRAERARKVKTDPDMMPEFFNPENFSKGEEDDSVRCVCGATANDDQEMIACDQCNVWQHNACMGEAVPEDAVEGTYLCHMCDPFAHRRLIAQLRRDNPL